MKTEFGSEYLHAEDLLHDGTWREFTLTVKAALPPNTVKASDGKLIDKPILEFEKTEKRLVLGKTNQRLCKFALGTGKPAEWVGKSITIYAAKGNWFGQQNVAAIRVRIPESGAKPFLNAKHHGEDLTGRTQ